jgi:fructokinase
MKILCIGEALIDMICTDKGRPLAAGEHFLKKPGGAPTNVAAAIAALGGDVSIAAKVGADPFGDFLVQEMKSFTVDTSYLLQDKTSFTTFAFVSLMENGERDFYFNRGADAALSRKEVDAIDLTGYSIVHFGSATGFLPGPLQEAYLSLHQRALEHGCFISFDPNYRPLLFKNQHASFIKQSWHLLKHCHFFKVSEEEATLLTNTDIIEDAANYFLHHTTSVFAITLGKEGTLLGKSGTTYLVPSIPVQPVDTTGAGDAFVGAVLYQLGNYPAEAIDQLSVNLWQQMIANGNKAGARTCEYLGAMEAFRHLSSDIFI